MNQPQVDNKFGHAIWLCALARTRKYLEPTESHPNALDEAPDLDTRALRRWSVGDVGTIIHTSNGGTTWTAQTSGSTQTLRQSSFADPMNGCPPPESPPELPLSEPPKSPPEVL